ncbi:MAG TPA: NusG domain II-containing protein [Candidatus Limnocylindria bacterium]|nr:NusG domain II-containing protein [Candidatus Limnocylindria bacterium]
MKRRDLWAVGAVLALGLLLLIASRALRPLPGTAPGTPVPLPSSSPSQGALPEAGSYLRIKRGREYFDLVPLTGPGEVTVHSGNGQVNVVGLGKDSVRMLSANCPNQDCVRQGEVNLMNRDTRVLMNFITCLPHQVSLELLTRQEALAIAGVSP